jgi:O-antigen/teichoic acid export membrane protein
VQALNSLLRNTTFGIIASLLNRLGNTLLFIYVVRALGVDSAGVYALAIAYFFISSRFALWGLDHLLTREVAKDPAETGRYMSNFLVVRMALALISIVIFMLIISVANYESSERLVIALMLLAVLPENINNLLWAGFAAHEEFQFAGVGTLLGGLVKVGVGLLIIRLGYGLVAVAAVFVLSTFLAMATNLMIFKSRYVRQWPRPELAFIKKHFRVAPPFVFISVFFILDSRLDNILISLISTNEVVGNYAAAVAVFVAVGMLAEGFRIAVLPLMARYREREPETIRQLYEHSFKYLLILGLPLGIITIVLAEELISIVYRQDLPEAVPALQVLGLAIVFIFLNILHNRLLIAYDRQKLIALFLGLTAVVNILINLLLVPRIGAVGSAIARVASIVTLFVFTALAVARIGIGARIRQHVWRPLLAAVLMAIVIWLLAGQPGWIRVGTGALAYVIGLVLLGTFTARERAMFHAFLKQSLFSRNST